MINASIANAGHAALNMLQDTERDPHTGLLPEYVAAIVRLVVAQDEDRKRLSAEVRDLESVVGDMAEQIAELRAFNAVLREAAVLRGAEDKRRMDLKRQGPYDDPELFKRSEPGRDVAYWLDMGMNDRR